MMAVWSEINISALATGTRLDAEYYQPSNLRRMANLQKSKPVRFGDIAYVTDGIHASPDVVEDIGVQYLSAKCVKDNDFALGNTLQISKSQHEANKRTSIRAGDVLLTTVGTIGNASVVQPDMLPANMDRHLGLIRLNADAPVDAYFVSTFLNSEYGRFQSIREATGNVQLNLFIEKIKELKLPILRCAKTVSDITKQAYTKRVDSAALYAQAEGLLLSELGLGELDLSPTLFYERDFSDAQQVARLDAEFFQPATMHVLERINSIGELRVGDHYQVTSGYPWKSQYFLDNTETGEPFVRIRHCKPGYIDIAEISRLEEPYANQEGAQKALPSDLVIGMDGVRYFYGSLITEPCYVNQRVAHLKAKSDCKIPPEYLLLAINSPIGQKQLLREMTIAQTVGHITNESIRNLVLPSLPESNVERLVELVSSSFDAHRESRRLLKEAKRMVEEAVRGGKG